MNEEVSKDCNIVEFLNDMQEYQNVDQPMHEDN